MPYSSHPKLLEVRGRTLPGFDHVNRYWDRQREIPAAKILPGEYFVTRESEAIVTTLGSCVSACIRDPDVGIGGMNHFMLPLAPDGSGWGGHSDLLSTATRYGNFAMEHMINDILKFGGRKHRLEAKIFGGGQIIEQVTNIGEQNVAFVEDYLETEGIQLIGSDVGDLSARKVIYFPLSGRVLVRRLARLNNDTLVRRESAYREELTQVQVGESVELFDDAPTRSAEDRR